MVPRNEGMQITATSNAVDDAWDAAWDSDKEITSPVEDERLHGGSPERNRSSLDEERRHSSMTSTSLVPEEDDPSDAWDWNDEDAADEAAVEPAASEPATTRDALDVAQQNSNTELREVVISEKFQTSSIPQAILKAVIGVLNDGAILTQPKFVPMILLLNMTDITGTRACRSLRLLPVFSIFPPFFLPSIVHYPHYITLKI